MAPAALEIHDVSVAYGKLTAVRSLSLRVEQGEVVALLGANGAGKSSTLKAISGQLRPRTGQISVDGANITGWSADRIAHRGVIHVPEGRQLFARMTVRENLLLGRFARRDMTGWEQDLERVNTLFPLLADRASQVAGSLSGGEQQMVAIGRGLMGRPHILMLDEPSLGLAPLIIERIFDAMDEINEAGTAVLLVEQNVHLALASSDRAYVLAAGALQSQGVSAQLAGDRSVQDAYLGDAPS